MSRWQPACVRVLAHPSASAPAPDRALPAQQRICPTLFSISSTQMSGQCSMPLLAVRLAHMLQPGAPDTTEIWLSHACIRDHAPPAHDTVRQYLKVHPPGSFLQHYHLPPQHLGPPPLHRVELLPRSRVHVVQVAAQDGAQVGAVLAACRRTPLVVSTWVAWHMGILADELQEIGINGCLRAYCKSFLTQHSQGNKKISTDFQGLRGLF